MSAQIPSATDGYQIGPLCAAIAAEDFAKWLEAAQVGDRLNYGWGPEPPRQFAVFSAVSTAVSAQLVRAHQERGGRGWTYFVVRRAASACVAPPAASVFPDESEEGRLLCLLTREAEAGRPCPTNSVLAGVLGLSGAIRRGGHAGKPSERARYLLRKLEKAGLISLDLPSADQRRIVTICATGKKTAAGLAPRGRFSGISGGHSGQACAST